MAVECEVCGNPYSGNMMVCPFCKSRQENKERRKKSFRLREVDLEFDRPIVEAAIRRLEYAIQESNSCGYTVLIFIHGYGSSGKGGAIRSECRKMFDYLTEQGKIAGFIPGEELSIHQPSVKQWVHRFPKLANNQYMNQKNQGITVVFL